LKDYFEKRTKIVLFFSPILLSIEPRLHLAFTSGLSTLNCIFKVQAALVICGLFIFKFEYMRLKNGLISGTYSLIYSDHWSFYMRIHYMRAYFWSPYLSHITRSACTIIVSKLRLAHQNIQQKTDLILIKKTKSICITSIYNNTIIASKFRLGHQNIQQKTDLILIKKTKKYALSQFRFITIQ